MLVICVSIICLLVQPRLVENRVYAYKAYPQTVEDELDRKDTRLVPSRQCLFHSHGAVSPTNVCVLFPHRQPHLSGGHRSFPVVRKETTMKTISGNREHHQPDTAEKRRLVNRPSERDQRERKTIGEREQTLSDNLSGK